MRLLRITELRRFSRSHMSRAAIAVACLIPLLYGALYLWAFWNPTGHLDQVPVALVNLDSPAKTSAGDEVSAGKTVADKLTESEAIGWHATTQGDALDGLEAGRYQAVLTIPAGFSTAVTTAGTANPVKAPLQVTYDDANGYTARTIVSSVMREVRTSVSDSVGSGLVDKLLIGFNDVHSGLVKASDGASQLNDGASQAADGAHTLTAGATSLTGGAKTLADGLATAHTGSTQLAAGATSLADGTTTAATGATQLATGAQSLADGTTTLAKGLPAASDGAAQLAGGAASLSSGASTLATSLAGAADATSTLPAQTKALAAGSAQVDAGVASASGKLTDASATLTQTRAQLVASLTAQLGASDPRVAALDDALGQVETNVSGAATQLTGLSSGAHQVAVGNATLAEGAASISSGLTQASTGAGQLRTGAATLSTGASTLSDSLATASSGATELATGASTLAIKTSELATGLDQLSTGAGTLASKTGELDAGLATLADGGTQVATGAAKVSDGSASLATGLDTLHSGAGELAGKLADSVKDVPSYADAERAANAEMMSAPVALDASWTHQAESNGEGFAPYFIGLSLWVGGLIIWMLLRPVSRRALAAPVRASRVVLAGLLPAMVIGGVQVVLLLGVLRLGLGLNASHLAAYVGLGLLVSLAFVAFQQTLNIWLGAAVGRLATLVLLMLQLTSAGGTYPASTTPGFFQVLHSIMPMTQVVNGFREAITGDLNPVFFTAVQYLVGLVAVSLALSVWGSFRSRVWTVKRLHPEVSL